MPLLAAKIILIRARATGILGIRGVVEGLTIQEEKEAGIAVKVVEAKAI